VGKSSENSPKARYLEVEEATAGQRIDNFLLTRLKGVPKSWIYRVLRRGEVRVNKGRVKPSYRLSLNDQVRIPPLRVSPEKNSQPGDKHQTIIKQSILFEDKELLLINKPSGYAVHGGSGISHGVIEILRSLRPDAPYLELAHRLDRDTSGCLLIAKKRAALQQLQKLQLQSRMQKRYQALLAGHWRKGKMKVDVPLRKNTLQGGERVVRVDAAGKTAVTYFTVLEKLPNCMLVEARLETGRTHQIRVHAAHVGAPVLGDSKYGLVEVNQAMRAQRLNRLFLHAWRLRFPWEGRSQPYDFIAPLPTELTLVVDGLRYAK
jgi:23S rRNA pseudouridine955/2504/2580 synthase